MLRSNSKNFSEYFAQYFPQAVLYPLEATYLQWVDFHYLNKKDKELEFFMQNDVQLFFTDGYKFGEGGNGFERWNIACPTSVLLEGLDRLNKSVNK